MSMITPKNVSLHPAWCASLCVQLWQCSVCVCTHQATMTLYGGELIPYYLNEEQGWGLDIEDLRKQTYKVGP